MNKVFTITTNTGFSKQVASTGNSPLAKVAENMKVWGNQNARTGKQVEAERVAEKYGYEVLYTTGYEIRANRQKDKTPRKRKQRSNPLTNEEAINLLNIKL